MPKIKQPPTTQPIQSDDPWETPPHIREMQEEWDKDHELKLPEQCDPPFPDPDYDAANLSEPWVDPEETNPDIERQVDAKMRHMYMLIREIRRGNPNSNFNESQMLRLSEALPKGYVVKPSGIRSRSNNERGPGALISDPESAFYKELKADYLEDLTPEKSESKTGPEALINTGEGKGPAR